MSSKPLFLHPEAQLELEAAFQWYAERSAWAAAAFLAEVDRALTIVGEGLAVGLRMWRTPAGIPFGAFHS